jgi:hypothetical protein
VVTTILRAVIDLRQANPALNQSQIARRLFCSREYVRQILRRFDLPNGTNHGLFTLPRKEQFWLFCSGCKRAYLHPNRKVNRQMHFCSRPCYTQWKKAHTAPLTHCRICNAIVGGEPRRRRQTTYCRQCYCQYRSAILAGKFGPIGFYYGGRNKG